MKIDLNGTWTLSDPDRSFRTEARVPGSVCATLIRAGLLADPKVKDQAGEALKAAEKDYCFERTFEWPDRPYRKILLVLEGIDTLGEILLNGREIGRTEDMHTTYTFDLAPAIRPGENKLEIRLFSPLRYLEAKQKEREIFCPYPFSVPGYAHLRKAHCMFGWDWGPKVPDLGIFRSVWIAAFDEAMIQYLHVVQRTGADRAELEVSPDLLSDSAVRFSAEIRRAGERLDFAEGRLPEPCRLEVRNPALWYPNGMGDQPLYEVCVRLLDEGGEEIDRKSLKIGLRDLRMRREKDEFGESFAVEVNGQSLFAMGANVVPMDLFPEEVSKERMENLIRACAESNFNCVRVWGGGIYPEDAFYDLCDRFGLLVWQDLMFGCANYADTEQFERIIEQEITCNVKRIRGRSCLLLLCGDNEIEEAQSWPENPAGMQAKADYAVLFGHIVPNLVKKLAPEIFYWPSSPSSGGHFDDPRDETRGDRHYWQEWVDKQPFDRFKEHTPRFCSEFGFESCSSPQTMSRYLEASALFPNSASMMNRQKHPDSEEAIVRYLFQNHRFPCSFEDYVYKSQVMQSDSVRTAAEHFRRQRGRCMGALFWQLNDVWPCTSFSSIDYDGRRKPLQESAKRFFAPILLSADCVGEEVELTLINEKGQPFSGEIRWLLCDGNCRVLRQEKLPVSIGEKSAALCASVDVGSFPEKEDLVMFYSLWDEQGRELSEESLVFCKPKDFRFRDPALQVCFSADGGELILRSKAYVRSLWIEFLAPETTLSKNHFDLFAGKEYRLRISSKESPAELKKGIKIFHL